MFKSSLGRLGAGLVFAAGLLASSAASAYSDIFVFGDSLSDSGNVFAATGGFPPAPYYDGRFSNGPTYAEDLAGMLGMTLSPSLLGGNNYAFGGATAAPGSTIGPLPTDLGTQVGSFLALPGSANADALYVLWAGGNDLRAVSNPADAPSVIGAALTGISSAVQALYADGARNFLVMNLPNLGLTPESTLGGISAEATFLSATFNTYFDATITGLRGGLAGSSISTLDTFALVSAAAADPGAFGFTNTTDACFNGLTVCANPDGYLFWDAIHPTAAGHELIARAAFGVLPVPEPETYAMLLAGLGLISLARRRRANA